MYRFIIALSLAFFMYSANAQFTNGLIAHWDFNSTTNDISGNGHNGTPFNISYTSGKAGIANTAASFNGNNAYILVPHQADLNITNYTICAVVKPTAFYTGTCQGNFIMFRGSEGASGSYGMGFFDNAYNDCSIRDTNLHVFYAQAGTSTGSATAFQSSVKVHTDTWYCVCATYDGSSIKIYVNGALTATFTINSGSMGTASQPIGIGKYLNGGATFPYWFSGAIDDLRLYNRAFTLAGVDSFCNAFSAIDTTVYISKPLNKTAFCPGDTVHVNYKVTFPFRLNNTFTAQLSNATGGFANPVNIGALAYNGDSVVICTIPGNTLPGTGYRIRIIGSAPADTSVDNGVNLTVHPIPTPAISSNAPFCEGDTIQLTATYTSATFSWTGPGGYSSASASVMRLNATTAMSGTYTVVATANGCIDTSDISVTVDTRPAVSITATDSLCALDTIFLMAISVPPAGSYNWKGPISSTNTQQWTIPNAQNIHNGWYVVTATSVNGCSSKDSVKIHVTEIPLELGDSFLLCNLTNRLTLNIPGATYLWQDSSTANEYHITQSGTYYVTVNLNGCTKTDTTSGKVVFVNVGLGNDTSLCQGDVYQLSVADTFDTYLWNTNSIDNSIDINKAGSYSVLVTKERCTATDTIEVTYLDPWFDLGNDKMLCNGEQVTLKAESLPGSIYTWGNGYTGPVYEVREPGRFNITVENVCGVFRDTVNIDFQECNCRPYIANAFSPNNDGHNDKISPKVFCPAGYYKFVIANRWGNIVFESTNPNERWDGTYKGKEAELGTYFYYYEITGPDGKEYTGKGDIMLIR